MSLENTSVYGEFISFFRLKRTLTIVFSYYLTYDNVNRVYDMCFRALYMLWAVFIYICISPYLFARSNKCLKFNLTNSKKKKQNKLNFSSGLSVVEVSLAWTLLAGVSLLTAQTTATCFTSTRCRYISSGTFSSSSISRSPT